VRMTFDYMLILKTVTKTLILISLLMSQIAYATQTSRFKDEPGHSRMIVSTQETEDEEPLYENLNNTSKANISVLARGFVLTLNTRKTEIMRKIMALKYLDFV